MRYGISYRYSGPNKVPRIEPHLYKTWDNARSFLAMSGFIQESNTRFSNNKGDVAYIVSYRR